MKIVKRILLVVVILLVLLIGAAIALPILFKDELLAFTKTEINKNVNAKVDFADAHLSLLRSFPDFSFKLEDYNIYGVDEFEGIALAQGKELAFTLDVMSVIKADRPIEIHSVSLIDPKIDIRVLKNGKANYDIAIPSADSTATEESADYGNVRIQLQKYNIENASIRYEDKSADTYLNISGLDHSGKGDFTLDIFDLTTTTHIDELSVAQGGIPYLKKARTDLEAVFNIDMLNSKYTFKENKLSINDLILNADGFVQMPDEDIVMDIAVSSPQNEFKNLLSLIPNAYIAGYENVKADGQFEFAATVKGTYNGEKEQLPGFNIKLEVENANVQYPDLPMGISGIYTQALVNSPGSDLDQLTVDVPRFSMKLGSNPFTARFNLKTPISDPDLKAEAKGTIDLAQLAKAFPMDGVDQLNGIINADVRVDTRLSYIEAQAYEKVNMDGGLRINNMNYKTTGLPSMQIQNMDMAFTPQKVNLKAFDAKLGKSEVQAQGNIDNILAYFSPEKTMRGDLSVRSRYFNADEWMPAEEEGAVATSETTAEEPVEIFDRFDFKLDARADKIDYDVYTVTDAIAIGQMTPNQLTVSTLMGKIGNSDFRASGVITNLFDYLFEGGVLGGSIKANSNLFDLNQFMPEETASSSTSTSSGSSSYGVVPVPPNIDMEIHAEVAKVIYTNLELNNIKGRLVVEDEAVVLDGVTANAFGGSLGMSGSYDTKDVENPAFSFKYDMNKVDFQKAFSSLNTFQQIAPIGQYIAGIFSTTFIMDGTLGKDLMPKLESLNAEGFLETINGIIQSFPAAQSVGNKLNIDYLKDNIKIENTKNWFEVKDGALEIKPYDTKVKDIALQMGGKYFLNNNLDFDILAKVPRKTLENNALGAAAGTGFKFLQGEASKLGIDIKQGEFVNLKINLSGDWQKPKLGLKVLGMDGEGETSLVDAAKEEVKDQVNQKVEEVKQEAKDRAQKAADSLKTVAKKEADKAIDKAKQEAEKAAKEKLGEVIDSTTQKKVEEALGEKGQEAKDKIEDKLKDWNPFGKKKKN
ncbi:MAG TPA: AsmA-like C-terminal region-containing protein [Saprospiraceae bacterium]|nr:AsmA-like C-terminal region-containing protein [Saprospiraceae bacterium]HMQ83338.1 AsmA-like C-terminal region-containing protein [Saprospiraceae bacterium]